MDFLCDRQASAFIISNSTKHVNVIVRSRFVKIESSSSLVRTYSVPHKIFSRVNKRLPTRVYNHNVELYDIRGVT